MRLEAGKRGVRMVFCGYGMIDYGVLRVFAGEIPPIGTGFGIWTERPPVGSMPGFYGGSCFPIAEL